MSKDNCKDYYYFVFVLLQAHENDFQVHLND